MMATLADERPFETDPTDHRFDMLIGGRLVAGGRTLEVVNPATGAPFATCACAVGDEIDAAVEAAARAFPGWAATPLAERQGVLVAMAEVIEHNLEELARLVTLEQGKPLADARAEVGGAAYFLRHYAAVEMAVEVIEDSERRSVELHRTPLGVVAAIVPWNFPVLTAVNKMGAALITGNTVVVKPAATTPVATLRLGALLNDAVPPGVVNIVADANDLGALLTGHAKVRKVSFTGSTGTGMKVMASGATTLKRMTLELGGNDAAVVLDDCDPDVVAPKLFDAAFMNNGQVCIAVKRLYVHDSQYDAIVDRLSRIARDTAVGPGINQGVRLGPVQNKLQFEKLQALIAETREAGEIVTGGDSPDGPGYFINPTIVRDIADDSRLVRDEQFGPVLPVLRYDDIDAVVARINDSDFGLGNSVWSADENRAIAVAQRLESGSVWINQHGDVGPDTPFAGAKMSGVGIEMSAHGLNEFTQVKVVNRAKAVAV